MEFSKHIGKGLWAFADKSLPAIYGVGFILLVIRVLPAKEFGAFVIIQTIFTLIMALGTSFAFGPLTKFAAESDEDKEYISSSIILGILFFALTSILILVLKYALISLLDRMRDGILGQIILFLPLLFVTAFYRTFAVSYLQAKYQVQRIFWIDAVNLFGLLFLIYLAQHFFFFSTAFELLILVIIAQSASSLLALIFTRKALDFSRWPQITIIKKVWDFGKYSLVASTSYNVFAQMDVFFISSFAGVYYVAIYNAAKIVTRLFDIFSQLLMMLLVPFASKYYSQQRIDYLIVTAEKSICFSSLLLFPALLIMILFPEQLLTLLYKDKYHEGVTLVRIFGILALSIPWNAVASSYMAGMGKVKESLYFGIGLLLFSTFVYSVLTPRFGILGTGLSYVGSLILMTIGVTIFIRRFVPFRVSGVIYRIHDVFVFMLSKILLRTKK